MHFKTQKQDEERTIFPKLKKNIGKQYGYNTGPIYTFRQFFVNSEHKRGNIESTNEREKKRTNIK